MGGLVRRTIIFMTLLWVVCVSNARAQRGNEKVDTATGEITGSVKDTALNYFMQSATVAVYKNDDSSLVAYSLTNGLGEFHIRRLPLSTPLYIQVSFIGYLSYKRSFSIFADKKKIELGELYLAKGDQYLNEVIVTNSPVRMHGDTLEFSAGAFRLEKNAVAEDLLKVLPGVIIWGDGTITVNGRPINKLLVDGKPFFGGEYKIATQNIPKTAVDKVQVYQESVDPNNPLDSITSINLKLKAGHHAGLFGVVSASQGTDERYGAAANVNVFTGRDQLAVGGQVNNTNRLANDVYGLLRNNTYKGKGLRVEYQPDFSMRGANEQTSGGFVLSHDFIPEYTEYNKNRVATASFINKTVNTTTSAIETIKSVGNDSLLRDIYQNQTHSERTEFNLDGRYSRKKNWDSLYLTASFNNRKEYIQNAFQSQTRDAKATTLNTADQSQLDTTSFQRLAFTGAYEHHGFLNSEIHRLTNWSLLYSLKNESGTLNRSRSYTLLYPQSPSSGLHFSRRYADNSTAIRQSISFKLGDFANWLFPNARGFSGVSMQFVAELSSDVVTNNDMALDRNPIGNSYVKSYYMSRKLRYTAEVANSGFRVGKIISYSLANRYQKDLNVYFDGRVQVFADRFSSDQVTQTQTNIYSKFVPTINVGYINYQYGEYANSFNLNIGIAYDYPGLRQRYGLSDSTEIFFIEKANPLLVPAKRYDLVFKYSHMSYRLRNVLSYGATITAGLVNNFVGDNILIDQAGRLVYQPINVDGRKHIGGTVFVNKAYIFDSHQLQVNVTGSIKKIVNPGFLGYAANGLSGATTENVLVISDSASFTYTYRNAIALNFLQNILYYKSEQSGFSSTTFANTQLFSKLGIGISLSRRASLSSNLSINSFPNLNSDKKTFVLWNATFSYKFLKEENLELKLSALDLLRQNQGIINYSNNYSYSRGTVSTLRQYFAIDLSYFPRKFGSAAPKKSP